MNIETPQLSIKNLKVKVVDLGAQQDVYVPITDLVAFDQAHLANLSNGYYKDLELIKRYYRTCFNNKKQPQNSNRMSGRKRVTSPSGTNRGVSRQPRTNLGHRSVVSNVPNAVKGSKALPYSQNQNSLQLNRKEKQKAVKLLLLYLLRSGDLYLLKNTEAVKTTAVLKRLRTTGAANLRTYLADPVAVHTKRKKTYRKGPVLIMKDQEKELSFFSNTPNCHVLNQLKTNYFGVYNGGAYTKSIIFTPAGLLALLNKVYCK